MCNNIVGKLKEIVASNKDDVRTMTKKGPIKDGVMAIDVTSD